MLIALIIKITSKGPILHWSERIGKDNKTFFMPKFRTMKVDTPNIATDKLENPDKFITTVGVFLRNSSLDEVPQLLNVLKGDMSIVGPRPCLSNQKELIVERKKRGVFNVTPGITGLAQISGINMETPTLLAETDMKMINKLNLYYYFLYILKTVLLIFKKRA